MHVLRLLLASSLVACLPETGGEVCSEAIDLLTDCGVSLPYLADGLCVGTRVHVAECILDHAETCYDLAELHNEYQGCVDDVLADGDTVPDAVPWVELGTDTFEAEDEDTDELCSDGLDNDGDGAVDCGQESCLSAPEVTVCG